MIIYFTGNSNSENKPTNLSGYLFIVVGNAGKVKRMHAKCSAHVSFQLISVRFFYFVKCYCGTAGCILMLWSISYLDLLL